MAYFRRYSGDPTGVAPAHTAANSSRKGPWRYVQCFIKRFELGECKTEATVFKRSMPDRFASAVEELRCLASARRSPSYFGFLRVSIEQYQQTRTPRTQRQWLTTTAPFGPTHPAR
jgi:hypothetical protein